MNRKIKFRAKRSDNNDWVHGDLIHASSMSVGFNNPLYIRSRSGVHYEVDKDTISQFTGLYDKNGREIYEGDILTADDYPFMCDGKMNYVAVIEWFDYDASWYASFQLHADSNAKGIFISRPVSFDEDAAKTYRVIGNIHDNPELIKEKQPCEE